MIDYEKSAELNGMGVEELKVYFERYPGSGKRVIAICDKCELKRNLTFQNYSDLCHKCANGTPEMIEAKRLRGIEQFSIQKSRDDQAERLKQYYIDNPEVIEKMSVKKIQYYEENSEVKKVISKSVIQYNKDHPEAGRSHSEWMIQYYKNNPEVLFEKTKMWREYWDNQDNRDVMSEIIKQYNINHPEVGEAHSEFMIEYCYDPEVLANMSKRMIEYYKLYPEAAEHRSAGMQGIPYEDWEGFSEGDWRDWDKAVYINESFMGCHRHHITETIVVCIPGELHSHIWHNLKTGLNMGEINALAIQFINGGL